MTDGKSPRDRLLDLVVFVPAGLALTLIEELPGLAEKGRHRVEGQVHTARLVGQFAVQFGRAELDKRLRPPPRHPAPADVGSGAAGSHRPPPGPPDTEAEAPPGVGGAPAPAGGAPAPTGGPPRTEPPVGGSTAGGSAVVTAGDRDSDAAPRPEPGPPQANGHPGGDPGLAIPGYDTLSASQVVQRLGGLAPSELEAVRHHELSHRHRRTILSRVDQLLAGGGPSAPA